MSQPTSKYQRLLQQYRSPISIQDEYYKKMGELGGNPDALAGYTPAEVASRESAEQRAALGAASREAAYAEEPVVAALGKISGGRIVDSMVPRFLKEILGEALPEQKGAALDPAERMIAQIDEEATNWKSSPEQERADQLAQILAQEVGPDQPSDEMLPFVQGQMQGETLDKALEGMTIQDLVEYGPMIKQLLSRR